MNDDTRLVARFGEEVREARRLLGWSQVELADHARTSQSCISRIEHGGHVDLHFVNALGVARALGIALSHLGTPLSPTTLILCQLANTLPLASPPALETSFTTLLRTFHGLPHTRREQFVRIVLPIAAALDGAAG